VNKNPFTYPLDEEVEKILENLPLGLHKPIWKLITLHRKEKPVGFNLGLQFLDPKFSSVENANNYLSKVMHHLSFHRQQSFYLDSIRCFYKYDNLKLRKRNEELETINKDLEEEVKRLKLTISELIGKNKKDKKKKTEADSDKNDNKNNEEKKEKKKRGAPKGHIGKNRETNDDRITSEENIFPEKCSCGCCDIEIIDKSEEVIVEDIKIIITKTKKTFYRGLCKSCGKEIRNPEAAGPPVRVGSNVSILYSLLRQNLGASYRNIADFSTRCLNLPITQSGVIGIINRISQKSYPAYLVLQEQMRMQNVLHGDETGWKMDGKRWYLWAFCNDDIAFFHADKSRSRNVIKTVLGSDFQGLMHADFYAAYNHIENIQRCLIHFDRDIKKELEITPEDKILNKMKELLWNLIETGELMQKEKDQKKFKSLEREIKKTLNSLCKLKSKRKVVKKFIKRINLHKDSLITFAYNPEAEYHNNKAERQIRPSVIFRKMSFGNRSELGAKNHAILTTINQTCKLRKIPPDKFLHELITAKNENISSVVSKFLN